MCQAACVRALAYRVKAAAFDLLRLDLHHGSLFDKRIIQWNRWQPVLTHEKLDTEVVESHSTMVATQVISVHEAKSLVSWLSSFPVSMSRYSSAMLSDTAFSMTKQLAFNLTQRNAT